MSRPTPTRACALRFPLSLTAAAALVAGTALAAGPAQAALVNGTVPNDAFAVLMPVDSPAAITFTDNREEPTSATFPAGTYWLGVLSATTDAPPTQTWQAVNLAAAGPLATSLPSVGAAGTVTNVLLYAAPEGAGDPAGMTPEQIDELLDHTIPVDFLTISAARVAATQPAPSFGETFPPEEVDIFEADFHDIGADTPAYRLGNVWHIADLGPAGAGTQVSFGRSSDEAFAGDWDGDGRDTLAVKRGSTWYFDNDLSGGAADVTTVFGRTGDEGLTGDWDGDGTDSIGIRRGNVFHLRNDLAGGPATVEFAYGRASDVPWVGDWDFDGMDTISVLRENLLFVKDSLTGGPADEVLTLPGG